MWKRMISIVFAAIILMSTSMAHLADAEENDPEKETPTDDTIEINIENVDYKLEWVGLNKIKLILIFTGTTTTTGNATIDHIGSSMVATYFKNGTVEGGQVEEYPAEGMNGSAEGFSVKVTSLSDNWTKWKVEYEIITEITIDETGNISADLPKVDKSKIFVRAYSDQEGNNWTQDSADITTEFKNQWNALLGLNDDDDSPGFTLIALIVAISLLVILGTFKRKRYTEKP